MLTNNPVVVDEAAESLVVKRVALRFLPVLVVGYLLNYLDRTNLGFAALTMNKEIGLNESQFGFGAGLFFFAYCAAEVPSNIVLYRVGARVWLARIMMSWGIASAVMALVVGPYSFYGARLLLGAAEAGFFPGVAFFLSSWFPTKYRARILAWFLLSIPLSSLLGGPVSAGLLYMDGILGLPGWKWMFLIEGLPTVLVGVWALCVLSDRPETAEWLSERERSIMMKLLTSEQMQSPRTEIWLALRDLRVHILALIQFGFTAGSYGIGIWQPLILNQFLSSPIQIGLVSTIPYIFASIAMLAWANYADRHGRITLHLALACALGAGGLAISVTTHTVSVAMIGLTLALVGVTAARAVFWTIPGQILSGIAAAAGFAYINTVAAIGGFVGPSIIGFAKSATGSFNSALMSLAGILLITVLLVWPLHYFWSRSRIVLSSASAS